ncbi:MAG: NAD(P)H-binding protein [Candidatus Omnitrophica bacterium]|nr:NAD(P)H-binding protein [Candidatus Omnitrophota bacterium]
MENRNVLIAGVGGVLGRELVEAFIKKGIRPAGLALSDAEFSGLEGKLSYQVAADVTRPETIQGVCAGMDIVVSAIGITRLRGDVTHMDVDYQGNMNLLAEAKRACVRKFVFISPAGTELGARAGVPLMVAKFKFEEELKKSGLEWVIVRASGFMRDFAEMGRTAEKGRMYIIGDGKVACTPIDVGELAAFMAEDALTLANVYTSVGGPRNMTWLQICESCFKVKVWGKPVRISFLPVWVCRLALALIQPFSFQFYALGKLLVFFSVNGLPMQRRGRIDLDTYLQHYYARSN